MSNNLSKLTRYQIFPNIIKTYQEQMIRAIFSGILVKYILIIGYFERQCQISRMTRELTYRRQAPTRKQLSCVREREYTPSVSKYQSVFVHQKLNKDKLIPEAIRCVFPNAALVTRMEQWTYALCNNFMHVSMHFLTLLC